MESALAPFGLSQFSKSANGGGKKATRGGKKASSDEGYTLKLNLGDDSGDDLFWSGVFDAVAAAVCAESVTLGLGGCTLEQCKAMCTSFYTPAVNSIFLTRSPTVGFKFQMKGANKGRIVSRASPLQKDDLHPDDVHERSMVTVQRWKLYGVWVKKAEWGVCLDATSLFLD